MTLTELGMPAFQTTIAKIYGKVLKALNLLSDGYVETKLGSDFIGSAVGESKTKTTDILKNSAGKVLLIDEACTLFCVHYLTRYSFNYYSYNSNLRHMWMAILIRYA